MWLLRQMSEVAPGLSLCAGLSLAGYLFLAAVNAPAFISSLVIAMLLGMLIGNLMSIPTQLLPGIAFSMRPVLRLGIVLLGFQLTLDELAEVGPVRLVLIAAILFATFFATRAVGRLLGVNARLSELIAAGTSVCGASAVLGVNTVTKGSDEQVAYAIACVTVFGSISMLVYPLLGQWIGLDAQDYGYWAGASVHEVAQAVGAGFAAGDESGEAATMAKLSRVILLAPLILLIRRLSWQAGKGGGETPPFPLFVLGFLAVVMLNSAVEIPAAVGDAMRLISGASLTIALCGMGLGTQLGRLRLMGVRPLALGAFAWLFISLAAGFAVAVS